MTTARVPVKWCVRHARKGRRHWTRNSTHRVVVGDFPRQALAVETQAGHGLAHEAEVAALARVAQRQCRGPGATVNQGHLVEVAVGSVPTEDGARQAPAGAWSRNGHGRSPHEASQEALGWSALLEMPC